MRMMSLIFDVSRRTLVDEDGNRLNSARYPYISLREKVLFNLTLINGDISTPFLELLDTDDFSVALDIDYNHASALWAKTEGDDFNLSGEWGEDDSSSAGSATADPEQGQLSFVLDANTAEFAAGMAATASRSGIMEVQAWRDSALGTVLQMPIVFRNLVDVEGEVPAALTTTKGLVSIDEGEDSITVSGLALGAVPLYVEVAVSKPSANDLNIFATLAEDSITADGFTVHLSGETDKAGYKLRYFIWL